MKKRHRPHYTFGDLVRVWKAAELNSKLTGIDFLEKVESSDRYPITNPTQLAQSHVYREGFVSLESFASFKTLFASTLPGITKKNLKEILRELRTRSAEFQRRSRERYSKGDFYHHPHRGWYYYESYAQGVRRHSFNHDRIYLAREGSYKKVLHQYANRVSIEGTVKRLVAELCEKVKDSMRRNGVLDKDPNGSRAGYSSYIRRDVSEYTAARINDMVRGVVFGHWSTFDNNTLNDVPLRSAEHVYSQAWATIYKDKNGRAGLCLCLKTNNGGGNKLWAEKAEEVIQGGNWWLTTPLPIIDKDSSIVVSRPDLIEDWEAFVKTEREGE